MSSAGTAGCIVTQTPLSGRLLASGVQTKATDNIELWETFKYGFCTRDGERTSVG